MAKRKVKKKVVRKATKRVDKGKLARELIYGHWPRAEVFRAMLKKIIARLELVNSYLQLLGGDGDKGAEICEKLNDDTRHDCCEVLEEARKKSLEELKEKCGMDEKAVKSLIRKLGMMW